MQRNGGNNDGNRGESPLRSLKFPSQISFRGGRIAGLQFCRSVRNAKAYQKPKIRSTCVSKRKGKAQGTPLNLIQQSFTTYNFKNQHKVVICEI